MTPQDYICASVRVGLARSGFAHVSRSDLDRVGVEWRKQVELCEGIASAKGWRYLPGVISHTFELKTRKKGAVCRFGEAS